SSPTNATRRRTRDHHYPPPSIPDLGCLLLPRTSAQSLFRRRTRDREGRPLSDGQMLPHLPMEAAFHPRCFSWCHSCSLAVMMSKAAPSGVCGLPRASRKRALRSVSSGQPNCSARLAAMALSRAHASAWLPHLWFEMKISPTQPSSKREYVHA